MERLKRICRKVFFPPPKVAALVALPSLALCFYMLATDTNSLLAYVSYGLGAYGLIVAVTAVVQLCSMPFVSLTELPTFDGIRRFPLGKRYLEDAAFRSEVALYRALFINLVYAVIKLVSGLYYQSLWFVALSVYYVCLSLIRFSLLHHVRKMPIGQAYRSELKHYRLCGILLIVLNVVLSAIVTMVVRQNEGFYYGRYLIYVMAVYAFYAVISSVFNVIRFRKHYSPVLSAAKVINLTAALVSMLSLETAMLSRFGGTSTSAFRLIMTAVTGFVVCALVLGMAVFMIVRACRELKHGAEGNMRIQGVAEDAKEQLTGGLLNERD